MKKCYAWLLILLCVCTVIPSSHIAHAVTNVSLSLTSPEQLVDTEGHVIFADALVESAIRTALGVPEGPITAKQLGNLGAKNEELRISAPSPVTLDLSVLQLCGKLRSLNLDQVTPADTSAISALKNLQFLFIRDANLSDFQFLSSCKKLTDLWIGGSPCRNISFVAELPKLCNFHIDSQVLDLSPLYASKKLVAVSIGQASDAEVNTLLDRMGGRLSFLGLKACAIKDETLERIAGMHLSGILIGGVPLSSIAPLWRCKSLQKLDLYRLPSQSLEGIQNLKKLRELSFEDMEGTLDMAPVFAMAKLKALSLNGVTVNTLSGIEGLKALTELSLYKVGGVTDYTPLCGLTKLQALYTDVARVLPEGLPVR